MKTLRAGAAVRYNLVLAGLSVSIIVFFAVDSFWKGDIEGGVYCIFFSILISLPIMYIGIKTYRTHWIKYGNGKVVICRFSKERVNGSPKGKWKLREDEFLLEEIDRYGRSKQVLGHDVEYYRNSASWPKMQGRLEGEAFFQLKNGKKIGYETEHFTKEEINEFLRYVFKGTGIPFQKEKGVYLIRDDGIFFQFGSVKNKLQYKEIKSIIISNHVLALKNKGIPYVAVVGEKEDEILQYCSNSERKHVLISSELRPKLFKKGSSTLENYGFTWRDEEMERVLEKYPGDYYIAASVLEYFGEKFDDLAKKYKISRERIHVIDDSTDGEFIWSER